jgi:hypothetical protein
VDVVTFNKAALLRVLPPAHPPALVSAASFVPTRGQKTSGLERFWNGRHRRPEPGLESSDMAWLDSTDTGADGLRVAPTPSTGEAPEREPPGLTSTWIRSPGWWLSSRCAPSAP